MPDEKDLQYLLLKIKSKYDSLPHACKKVADYLLASHDEAVFLNIKELAQKPCQRGDDYQFCPFHGLW